MRSRTMSIGILCILPLEALLLLRDSMMLVCNLFQMAEADSEMGDFQTKWPRSAPLPDPGRSGTTYSETDGR